MPKVAEVRNIRDFENLEAVWDELLRKSPDNDVFSSWEWLYSWWKIFGKGRVLRILVAKEKGEIWGIAPLMLSKYKFLHFGKLHKLEFIGSPQSDYNNFILVKKKTACLRLFLNYLVSLSDWDYLELKELRSETFAANFFLKVRNKLSNLECKPGSICPYISLPRSDECFSKKLSRNMRRNLHKRMRRLRKNYRVEFKTHEDFNSIEKAMNIFFDLHQKRWRAKGKCGVFANKAIRDFHMEVAKRFAKKGWLSLYFLTANDKPIAAIYSFDYKNKKYGYLTGFDPAYRMYGVGSLLRLYVVEDSIRRGLKEYDLTRGNEPYKADWANAVRRNLEIRAVNKGINAVTYHLATKNDTLKFYLGKFGKPIVLDSPQFPLSKVSRVENYHVEDFHQ